MSYLVLARKLRPQRFVDLIGQEAIHQTLINAIKTGRVAHAFLFTGPRGTGKTSCARILTKALNCANPQEFEPCNRCESCLEINQGISADVMEIDAASNRGIEHIRELRESVKFSPSKGQYKTYIIDEVHMLTTESFNALLKTLEEPPSHVKFILATTDPHKIPSTVVSRCQRFDFCYIPQTKMVGYLEEVSAQEGIKISPNSLRLIARASVGGMRDALTTLDMLVSFSGTQVEEASVVTLLGLGGAQEMDRMVEALVHKDLGQVLASLENQLKKGRSLDRLLSELMTAVKDLSLVKELPPDKLGWRELLPEQMVLYQKLAESCTTAGLQQVFQILLETEHQIRRSSQAVLALEMALVKICRLAQVRGLAEILGLMGEAKAGKRRTSEPAPTAPATPAVPEPNQAPAEPVVQTPAPEPVSTLPEPPDREELEALSQMEPPEEPLELEEPEDSEPSVQETWEAPSSAGEVLSPAPPLRSVSPPPARNPEPLVAPVLPPVPERPPLGATNPEPPAVPAPAAPSPVAALVGAPAQTVAATAARVSPLPEAAPFWASDEEETQAFEPSLAGPLAPPAPVGKDLWEEDDGDYDPSPEEMEGLDPTPPKRARAEDWAEEEDELRGEEPTEPDDREAGPDPRPPLVEAVDLEQETEFFPLPNGRDTPTLWAAVAVATEGEGDSNWPDFVARFAQMGSPNLVATLKASVALEFGPQKLVIGNQNPSLYTPEKREQLAGFARSYFGAAPKLEFVQSSEGQADSLRAKELLQRESELEQRKARAALDPQVTNLLEAFPDSKIKNFPELDLKED